MRRYFALFTLTVVAAAVAQPAGAAEPQVVSVNSNGIPAVGINHAVAITPSGRYVVFASNADNLPGLNVEDPRFMLLYVHDRSKGTTRLVSRRPNGRVVPVQVEGDISSDGRYIAFTGDASNRIGRGVFVRDLVLRKTVRVGRLQGSLADTYWPQLSADGRRIAFGAFQEGSEQAYVRDLITRRTRLLTPDGDGRPSSNSWVSAPSISGDGRFVAFEYDGGALPACNNGAPKVYGWRTRTTTCPVSGWGEDGAEYVSLSRTGRFLAWHDYTLRVTDLETAATTLVPEPSWGQEVRPSWSADERFLAFLSYPDAFPDGATSLYDRVERSVTHLVGCTPADRALTRHASAAFVTCPAGADGTDAVVIKLDN